MNQNPLVVIHGWSDNSQSFRKLAFALSARLKRKATLINLADYVSMDDAVTYDDLAAAMERAFRHHDLARKAYGVDAIVHSTGGLVIRQWLQQYYDANTAPIKHLVMLAPANFGSPLAHKGRAFYSRVWKGLQGKRLFHVGAQLLHGLELASPYTYHLALQDCFSKSTLFATNKILCTVLIGNHGYKGIAAAANEHGSDGTVRIASANLNCQYLTVDFSEGSLQPSYTLKKSSGLTAFGILEGENHSTIVAKDGGLKNASTLEMLTKALTVTDADFKNWCKELNNTYDLDDNSGRHGMQSISVKLSDQYNNDISDYFIEFYGEARHKNKVAEKIHGELIQSVHAYANNKAYRGLYFNVSTLNKLLGESERLVFNLTASPELSQNGDVGYHTISDKDRGGLRLTKKEVAKIFIPNQTLLVDIKLRREQSMSLFNINKLKQ